MRPRRSLLAGGAGLLLAGCDKVVANPQARNILFAGEDMHMGLQRALLDRCALAPEFTREQMSPIFRANGTRDPGTHAYAAMVADGFASYRLRRRLARRPDTDPERLLGDFIRHALRPPVATRP